MVKVKNRGGTLGPSLKSWPLLVVISPFPLPFSYVGIKYEGVERLGSYIGREKTGVFLRTAP